MLNITLKSCCKNPECYGGWLLSKDPVNPPACPDCGKQERDETTARNMPPDVFDAPRTMQHAQFVLNHLVSPQLVLLRCAEQDLLSLVRCKARHVQVPAHGDLKVVSDADLVRLYLQQDDEEEGFDKLVHWTRMLVVRLGDQTGTARGFGPGALLAAIRARVAQRRLTWLVLTRPWGPGSGSYDDAIAAALASFEMVEAPAMQQGGNSKLGAFLGVTGSSATPAIAPAPTSAKPSATRKGVWDTARKAWPCSRCKQVIGEGVEFMWLPGKLRLCQSCAGGQP